jgi:hypothetical protein
VPACGSAVIEHDVVMRGVTVVDVETGALNEDRTIAIDDSRVVFVGEDAGKSHRGRIEVAVSRGDVFDRQTLDRMLDQAATQASALDTTRRDLQSR